MVDVMKTLPPIPLSMSSNLHQIRSRISSGKVTLPIMVSTANYNYQNELKTNICNTKRWVGRCPRDPPRQNSSSESLYSSHRKLLDREIAQYYRNTPIDISASIKIKPQQQRNSNRDSLHTTTKTGATVVSVPLSTTVDSRTSRLLEALSKQAAIKAEPFHPENNFSSSISNTSHSWKHYWSSQHAQRRRSRKEVGDLDYVLCGSKYDPATLVTKHYVTIHDSSFCSTSNCNCKFNTFSTDSNSSLVTNVSSPVISDVPTSLIKEENHISLPVIISKHTKDLGMSEVKQVEDKPLPPIINKKQVIKNNDEISKQMSILATKIYKLPLPSNKFKGDKSALKEELLKPPEKKSATSTKSIEKREASTVSQSNTSPSRQRRRKALDRKSSTKSQRSKGKKQHSSSTSSSTYKLKDQEIQWEEPYVGVRYDPPTPPCTPFSIVYPLDN